MNLTKLMAGNMVASLCKLKGRSVACSVIYGLVIEGRERY